MAKGQIAKELVVEKLSATFGADWIGEFDKKYYVWADDGGERVQISISLTCPKVYRGIEETGPEMLNFDDDEPSKTPPGFKPADISPEEKETLVDLLKKMGL